jgi:type I restriction enzyme M protein
MALKKPDLYSSLWKSCDELRGSMDASQYKDYILNLLFVKYVTSKAKSDRNSLIDVPQGGSFDDILALKGNREIGDRINKIIRELAEANRHIKLAAYTIVVAVQHGSVCNCDERLCQGRG